MIKDHSKPTNTIGNLRPISIPNTLAQVFERLLLNKIPEIKNTHMNQFDKNNTSCSHALFTFKETIIHYLDKKQHYFAVSFDAVKAFDRVWREAFFYFLFLKKTLLSHKINLLRIYYDKL